MCPFPQLYLWYRAQYNLVKGYLVCLPQREKQLVRFSANPVYVISLRSIISRINVQYMESPFISNI